MSSYGPKMFEEMDEEFELNHSKAATMDDKGYEVGNFPTLLSTGAGSTDFAMGNNDTAFSGLRGLANERKPFEPSPYKGFDGKRNSSSTLKDSFMQNEVAFSALLPGQYNYEKEEIGLRNDVVKQFEAGKTVLASGDDAHWFSEDVTGSLKEDKSNLTPDPGAVDYQNLQQLHEMSARLNNFVPDEDDGIPVIPFARQHPNFGTGKPMYGFENGVSLSEMDEDILKAYQAAIPTGDLASTKKDLQPVFSGINVLAVAPRPILQSLGYLKGNRWPGGFLELPDHLKIDPINSQRAGGFIPTGLEQSNAHLRNLLEGLGEGVNYPETAGFGGTYGRTFEGSDNMRPMTVSGERIPIDMSMYETEEFQSHHDPYLPEYEPIKR